MSPHSVLAAITTVLLIADLRYASARCPLSPSVTCFGDVHLRYRTADGSCNNLIDHTLGMANTPFIRILPAAYGDGVHQPRLSKAGGVLPSARRLVTALLPDMDFPSTSTNMLVTTWAQLLSHDVARIQAAFPRANGQCCAFANATDTCDRIDVPQNDPFYSAFSVRCIGVDRSASAPCNSRAHEQNSQVTHFVDASFVYGSSQSKTRSLREMRGGRLRTQVILGDEFLPRTPTSGMDAGDARVTITPMLAALQTLFLREHNRVARRLSAVNFHWDDEKVFQETRRVVIAQWQLLTYRDWLQWIIGTDTVQQNGLLPSTRCCNRDYNATANPTVSNDFSSGAYRSFHSMIADDIWFGGGDGEFLDRRLLGDVSANVILDPRQFKRIVLGMVFQPRQTQDQFMPLEITGKLFRGSSSFGGDLVATDIQRGREHGLPSYNEYRKKCNLPTATSFNGFSDTISEKNIQLLRTLYAHPDDVDFLVGGLVENIDSRNPLASVTSPVFRCIVIDQFKRWKQGDRFFFDLSGILLPGFTSFTAGQMDQLRKQTMSRLICDNTPGVRRIPDDSFLRLGVLGNREVDCSSLQSIDFSAWRETRRGYLGK